MHEQNTKKFGGKFLLYVVLALIVVGALAQGLTHLATNYLEGQKTAVKVAQCIVTGASHTLTIKANKVQPEHLQAAVCDKLTVTNQDDTLRQVAFGQHDRHQAYDGVIERVLEKGQQFSVTLNQAGSFELHDHLHDEVQATFTVSE